MYNTNDRNIWDDKNKKHLINDRNALHTKVLSSNHLQSCNNDFNNIIRNGKHRVTHNPINKIMNNGKNKIKNNPLANIMKIGKNKLLDKGAFNRVNKQKKLSMFGDKDKDGIKNIFDPQPFKKNKLKGFKNYLR